MERAIYWTVANENLKVQFLGKSVSSQLELKNLFENEVFIFWYPSSYWNGKLGPAVSNLNLNIEVCVGATASWK